MAAIASYMVLRGSVPGPFFRFADSHYLTRDRLVSGVCSVLQRAGIDHSQYSDYSFHTGVATVAALCGLPDSLFKILGWWEGVAYILYIRTPRETFCSVARSLILVHVIECMTCGCLFLFFFFFFFEWLQTFGGGVVLWGMCYIMDQGWGWGSSRYLLPHLFEWKPHPE